MRSKKHKGWMGGSCHIGKNFKRDSESSIRKDCRQFNLTYKKEKSENRQLHHKRMNKRARQFDHLVFEDLEDTILTSH